MSPIVIAGLVLAGLLLLLVLAYINNLVENRKLAAARKRAELTDRIQRCAVLASTLPGQMLSPGLRLILARIELQWLERLLSLDKRNDKLQQRAKDLQALTAQGDALKVNAPMQQIATEAKAKEVRHKLEDLHGVFLVAAQEGILAGSESRHWQKEVQRLLVLMHADYFANAGKIALQQNQPRQARLAFERAIQYLNKQPDSTHYATLLRQLQAQLERTNALVLETSKPDALPPSELTEGLKALDDETEWKKKNLYE